MDESQVNKKSHRLDYMYVCIFDFAENKKGYAYSSTSATTTCKILKEWMSIWIENQFWMKSEKNQWKAF